LKCATFHTAGRCGAFGKQNRNMSYDIYFIKKKDLNSENVYDILETTEPNPENEIYISKDFMKSLIEQLKSEGLEFEIFEGKDEDYFELNFPTYQLSMYNSQLAISLPYWDENSSEGINKEIKQIANVFLKNDFTGFDPQTEEFITEPYELQKTFTETKTVVDNHLKSESQQSGGNNLMYLGIGLGILIIGLIVWKMIK
jgi:hypothetical protein